MLRKKKSKTEEKYIYSKYYNTTKLNFNIFTPLVQAIKLTQAMIPHNTINLPQLIKHTHSYTTIFIFRGKIYYTSIHNTWGS